MKKMISTIALTLLATSFASAGNVQITCTGIDGADREVQVVLTNIAGPGFGNAFGMLLAKTERGINTLSTRAWLVGREGKVTGPDIGFNKDLYIQSDDVALNLDKDGRQQYRGSLCGPRNNTNVAGIQFSQGDCFNVVCSSKGLSTLR